MALGRKFEADAQASATETDDEIKPREIREKGGGRAGYGVGKMRQRGMMKRRNLMACCWSSTSWMFSSKLATASLSNDDLQHQQWPKLANLDQHMRRACLLSDSMTTSGGGGTWLREAAQALLVV